VDLAWLDLVPAQVTGVMVYNIDFGGLYDTVLRTIKALPNPEPSGVDKAIDEFEAKAKVKIRQELLENLAGPMVTYSVPGGTISPLSGGGVFLLKLKDPKAVDKALTALEGYIAKTCEGKFQVTSQVMDGVNYHFWMIPQLAMAQISPCWTIRKDQLVIGTNMPLCSTAVRHTTTQNAEKISVRTTEGFKAVTKELPSELISFRYVDQRLQSEESMRMMQQFWPMMVMGLGQQSKIKLPMMLPPASDIIKFMGPQTEYSWKTAEGIRSHSQGPMMGSDMSMAAAGGIMAGMLMPAMGKARDTAKRTVSLSNLRQIGIAGIMYASDHKGNYPESLQDLVKEKYLPEPVLKSPLNTRPDVPSYIYIAGHKADSKPNYVLAYENPEYLSEGTNVLYVDGHVQWMKPEEFKAALAETYQRLGKPVPEVKFKSDQGGWNLGNLFRPERAATRPSSGVNLEKKIPFKCTNCKTVVLYSIRELQKMQKPGSMGPMMGPMTLDCPECKKKSLTQAVECPKCGEIFVMKMDPDKGLFDDKCPKCKESYAKAWQEKYKKDRK
jgi:prepilin-type processing-associated H-X9-DG protein